MLMVYLQGAVELCKTREHPEDPSKKTEQQHVKDLIHLKGNSRILIKIKGKTTKETVCIRTV